MHGSWLSLPPKVVPIAFWFTAHVSVETVYRKGTETATKRRKKKFEFFILSFQLLRFYFYEHNLRDLVSPRFGSVVALCCIAICCFAVLILFSSHRVALHCMSSAVCMYSVHVCIYFMYLCMLWDYSGDSSQITSLNFSDTTVYLN